MTRLAAHFSCIVCLGTVLVIVCARFLFIQVDESVRVKKAVKELSTFTNSPCSKKTTLVFVKVHKAGGTTVYRLLMTFGLRHRLNFVIPQHTRKNRGHNLGRRWQPSESKSNWNCRHLKSVMNFYDLPSMYKLPKKNPMKAFLSRPRFYEKRWRRHRKDQPFSYTNLMSFDMGIDPSSRLDTEYVRGHIEHLDAEFFLVLILEYLDESLVLLKRYMCWDISDIFYTTMNLMSYDQKIADASEKMRDQHRAWSVADYMLYEHFNRTLWRKIRQEGEDFWAEVWLLLSFAHFHL
ncbi:galactose-3-O-sulfotransferase 2-like [Branchiostoma floridae x Branchiostoma japonicum]